MQKVTCWMINRAIRMDFKEGFMLFWSLSSGFGIIFAISSWIYDINGIKQDPFFSGFKGIISLFLGVIIGITHYQISSNYTNDYLKVKVPRQNNEIKSNTNTININVKESELQRVNLKIIPSVSQSPENSENSNANSNSIKSSFEINTVC